MAESSSPPPQTSPAPDTSPPNPLLPPPDGGQNTTASPPYFPISHPPPPKPPGDTALAPLGIGIGIGGAVVLFFVLVTMIWYRRRKNKQRPELEKMYATAFQLRHDKDELGPLPQNRQHIAPSLKPNMVGLLPKSSPLHDVASNPQLFSMGSSIPPPPLSNSSGSEKLHPQASANVGFGFSKTIFTYEDLAIASDGFSSARLLGQGGFGYVHKGVLSNGIEVAIKQLKVGSGQGEREFQAEIGIISRVHHKHLVTLVGYCSSGPQRLLVYEYVPNNTLEFHLHGKGHIPIDWPTRMKVALGSAKGLAYLHEDCQPKIIHRDIKAANILLDSTFEPKVADFGLARFNSDTDTHVSTRVMGTFGYLAPEYALTGKLTEKSDVFSFGVVLLELITGRRPLDNDQFLDDNIVDWARPLLTQALEDGKFDTLADTRLQEYDSSEMFRMISCAAVCVRHLARRRPRMSQIARALEGNMPLEELNEGIRPGHSTIYGSHGSSDYDTTQYREDLSKFKKMAFESQLGEKNSSGWSGPTSNFGQQVSGSSSDLGSSIGTKQPQ